MSGWAATASYTGSFAQDDDVKLISFSLASTSDVVIRTYSYAGGTQADGNVVPAGGFDPTLIMFDGAGLFFDENDDAQSGTVPADPVTGEAFDALFEAILPPGSYTVALVEFDNAAVKPALADGFIKAGAGNFTGPEFQCGNGSFCAYGGHDRTPAWAVDVLTQPVPEPSVLVVLVVGLGTLLRLNAKIAKHSKRSFELRFAPLG